MGVRASLHEISAATFLKLRAGEEVDGDTLKDAPSAFLDKSWYDLHILFKQTASPLKHILEGDYLHPSSPVKIDNYIEGNGDYYVGFASPTLVKAIADILPTVTNSDLEQLAKQTGIPWESYCKEYFQELNKIYTHAARNGNALCITIA